MCRRFIVVDRDEVARIAAEIEFDLADHANELASLDPLATYEASLPAPVPTSAAMETTSHDAATQLSLFSDEPAATAAASLRAEAFPLSTVPLIVAAGGGSGLAVVYMNWGYEVPWKRGPVFNTRIETALREADGMWSSSFARRRCLVPAWGFYESHASETVPSKRTGRPVKRQYIFGSRKGTPLLLAGIHESGKFSLVTTEPNATVASVHNRMPLVLSPGEAALWLRGVYAPLLDRSTIELSVTPER